MSRAPRIDAHQHFWRIGERRGQWPPPQLATIHRDFLPPDLEPLRLRAGIDGTVLVQSLPDEADTRWMLSVADATPWVRGVVGWTDLKSPDAARRIRALASHATLKGLRPMLQDLPDDDWIADPALDGAAQAMVEAGLVFDALVVPRQLRALEVFARRHPALAIVIDHGAKPQVGRSIVEPWRADMARLAALPNVHCKLSGLLTEAGDDPSAARLRPYVAVLWELFGPARLLWGSDWPVLRLAGEYGAWLDMSHELLRSVCPDIADAQRDAVFGANAQRVYGLAPGP
jgi:L-fuconolactonase